MSLWSSVVYNGQVSRSQLTPLFAGSVWAQKSECVCRLNCSLVSGQNSSFQPGIVSATEFLEPVLSIKLIFQSSSSSPRILSKSNNFFQLNNKDEITLLTSILKIGTQKHKKTDIKGAVTIVSIRSLKLMCLNLLKCFTIE